METPALSRRDDLLAQIANIEARIARLDDRVSRGDLGEASTLAVRRGRHVVSGRNEHFLNINRAALADRKAKLEAFDAGARDGALPFSVAGGYALSKYLDDYSAGFEVGSAEMRAGGR